MEVNKIDLKEHVQKAVPYSEGRRLLHEFLNKHKQKGKRKHFKCLGQNVGFDIGFYKQQLVDLEEWNKIVDYRSLDTSSVCAFMQECGLLPSELGNLGSLVDHFGVKKREAHEAKDDTLMTIEVFKKMKETFKKNSLNSTMSSDLLSIIEE